MKEEFVSFEQAKALKECGFEMNLWRGANYIERIQGTEKEEWNDEECRWETTYDINIYPKLRLDQAQKWLREVKGVHVLPTLESANQPYYVCHITQLHSVAKRITDDAGYFSTYEAALSAGITEALKLLEESK